MRGRSTTDSVQLTLAKVRATQAVVARQAGKLAN